VSGPPGGTSGASFLRYGFSPHDADSRAALLDQAVAALHRLTGGPARWRWFVPGRLEVFGKHTDYAGGPSLVAAVPRGFAVAASDRTDGRVRVVDARNGDTVEIDPYAGSEPMRGWRNYITVGARRLAANFPGAELGADIAFISDLPRAAGLSSSSALIVGVTSALVRRGGIERRDEWLAAVQSPENRAEYLSCVENGHSYRSLEGARGVGTQGGSEDHAAILLGRAGMLSEFAFIPVRRVGDVAVPEGWHFAVASSGVHADKAGAVRSRYNRAARAADTLAALAAGADIGRGESLAERLAGGPAATDRLRAVIGAAPPGEFSANDLLRRLTHFLNEHARVPLAAAAFAAGDARRVADLAAASQEDAERLLGNQVAETTSLVAVALECGAAAASSFGAGFGGSAWALLDGADAEAFGRAWLDAYRRRHPSRVEARWFPARPAPGIIEIETATSA
jgi:galactokinase